MNLENLDIIGDIHGHADVLQRLLIKLGYKKKPFGAWSHPDDRKVVFLGDYIDRGPKIRETLHIVRSIAETGNGVALMGNHEHNAICMATLDEEGNPLRDRSEKNLRQAAETTRQFVGKETEWKSHLDWIKTLPFSLELGEIRAVHACWDPAAVEILKGKSLADPEVLLVSRKKSNPIGKAILRLLNGPELNLNPGEEIADNEGHLRSQVRVRWWDIQQGMTLGDCMFPDPNPETTKPLQERHLNQINPYPEDAPLTCFGHYWLPPNRNPFQKPNLICLDLSIAKGGRLACLRNHATKKQEIVSEPVRATPEKTSPGGFPPMP